MSSTKTMKAVIFMGDKNLEIRDVPIPRAKRGEAVVKIQRAALCGSDIHFYETRAQDFIHPNTICGHEPAGIVYEVGEDVANVKIGDRVCMYHFHGCGNCELCHAGHYNNCVNRKGLGWEMDGSNAEYIVMNSENCLKLPDELSMEDGAIISCIGGTTYWGLKNLGVSGRDLLVVYGLGAVGLATVLIAKAMGTVVIGVERNQYRLDFAKKLGCDYLINGEKEDIYERLMEISGGRGIPLSVEASGTNVLRKLAAKAAMIHGKICLLGFDANTRNESIEILSSFDTRHVIRKELTIVGSYVMPLWLYEEIKNFLVIKKVHLDSLVTHRFPLVEYQKAVDLFYTGNAGKIIFTMD